MIRLSDIRIGTKLAIMSGLSLLLVAGMIAGQLSGSYLVAQSDARADAQGEIGRNIMVAKVSLRGLQLAGQQILVARNPVDMQKAVVVTKARMKELRDEAIPLAGRVTNAEDRTRLEKLVAASEKYLKVMEEVVPVKTERFGTEAKQKQVGVHNANEYLMLGMDIDMLDAQQIGIAVDAAPAAAEAEKLLDELTQSAAAARHAAQAEADEARAFANQLAIGLGILAGVVLIATAFLGVSMIARPLRALIRPLESVAEGNFAIQVPGADRKDEVGQIAHAVEAMAQKVSATIAEIKASGREVTNASAEIAASTTDLSQRTEEQAASLEETSAAMEELAATVRKNAENAQLANQDANATREVADRGGQVVAKAVDAMAKIEESSRKISDIIGVIDEIARQTNLLALNAAVEAARAGEAGRGFAVVASEVRSLAQRSSQAAKDIKDLITNSNGQVKDGVDLVNRAGQSLTEIVESIKKVASVVSEIANASAEQATGIDEINRALNQMDEVTQQNSALVEENAATAKTLEHQAKSMDEQVAFFQIASGHDAQGYKPAAATRAEPVRSVAKLAAAKVASAKPAAPAKAVPVRKTVNAGPARSMQTALAKAVNTDDWKEF
ncbi:methyl-accepting chemotaxis protein [Pseudolabrys sp. FHR47]|uniref:methyl-accepting chemotaxis protein n=1 Tax=Pseudolabrys sp. FHR47 TaxID=2562284 RepID=UPI00143D0706|nr:methyl-accepting chemotaxis protein [Pseudolabrys sp. FHR47]